MKIKFKVIFRKLRIYSEKIMYLIQKAKVSQLNGISGTKAVT